MTSTVKQFRKGCTDCAERGTARDRTVNSFPIENHPEVCRPFQRASIDLMGPFPRSKSGNLHIAAIVDHFTKWTIAVPISSKEAREISEVLVAQLIFRHGAPDVIIFDNGSEFKNALNKWLASSVGSHLTHTAAYHPCSNGQVERLNGVLKDGIAKLSSDLSYKDWDTHVSKIVHAYNISVNCTTDYTPFFLVHGRECRTPLDNAIPTVPRFTIPNAQDYADDLVDGITAARNSAQTQLGIAHSLNNKPKVVHTLLREIPVLSGVRSKPMRRVRRFEVGDQVL
eukprot:gene13802-biopygen6876